MLRRRVSEAAGSSSPLWSAEQSKTTLLCEGTRQNEMKEGATGVSHLAKKPIIIPEKVSVKLTDGQIEVAGPLGKIIEKINPRVKVNIEDNKIFVNREKDERQDKMLQGLTWALIRNAVVGVNQGFKKELEIRGVGFQAQISGEELILRLGFSHPVKFKIPKDIKITVDQKGVLITVQGFNKSLVGEVAAQIRRIKPPDHYKGFGIRYVGEKVIKKAGKAAITVGAGAKK